ncbi:MAG TPA: hypothetical protein VEG27_07355 [Usitatibacter sp.]|nr:hypothetical protein [Usitatibacter sp.]
MTTGAGRRQRLAIVGFGRLGQACASEAAQSLSAIVAGVVRRPGSSGGLPAPFSRIPAATHLGARASTMAVEEWVWRFQ